MLIGTIGIRFGKGIINRVMTHIFLKQPVCADTLGRPIYRTDKIIIHFNSLIIIHSRVNDAENKNITNKRSSSIFYSVSIQ